MKMDGIRTMMRLLAVAVFSLFFCSIFFTASCIASPTIRIDGAQDISIEAKQIPLIDILKALSDQANIVLVTGDSLEMSVSMSIHADSLETLIERLLSKHNYALFFSQLSDGSFRPSEIRVFGSKSVVTYRPGGMPPLGQDDHMQHYGKEWYTKEFQKTEKLSSHITATPGKSSIQSGSRPLVRRNCGQKGGRELRVQPDRHTGRGSHQRCKRRAGQHHQRVSYCPAGSFQPAANGSHRETGCQSTKWPRSILNLH
jgi:hypothetical protein